MFTVGLCRKDGCCSFELQELFDHIFSCSYGQFIETKIILIYQVPIKYILLLDFSDVWDLFEKQPLSYPGHYLQMLCLFDIHNHICDSSAWLVAYLHPGSDVIAIAMLLLFASTHTFDAVECNSWNCLRRRMGCYLLTKKSLWARFRKISRYGCSWTCAK